ncbi:MAG: glucuronate isomerase [Bacteroidales bacterium]|nr:glucuronate isomerase [Bacteroidales bacterium]
MGFISEDFMLSTSFAKELYHESAESMPIIDYHCHLVPQQIAENIRFRDIVQLWLVDGRSGDHYKWRAMRGNGVPEEYITGDRSPWEKFEKWADTVQHALRNPLYHWTHLELKRVFGIDKVLNPQTAREIFEECNEKLASDDFRGQALIRKFGVETVCTTDDPADDLRWHKQIAVHPFGVKVLPAFRPDKVMAIEDPASYRAYIERLSDAAGMEIRSFADLMDALRRRHAFFEAMGCRLSDHGMDTFYADEYSDREIDGIFRKVLEGAVPSPEETGKFKSAILYETARMDAESGWTQQYHIGVIRNNNEKMFRLLGPDSGYDAILDTQCAEAGHRFFSRLALEDRLAKTILYGLNPKDNEVLATMAYTFNDGTCPGKMQLGAAWWFLDQEDGMRKQLNALSSLGLLSRFVGMLTDSRSFISYPRHEYFRRILCDVIGRDLADGKLPVEEMPFIHKMVKDICCNNARSYFQF